MDGPWASVDITFEKLPVIGVTVAEKLNENAGSTTSFSTINTQEIEGSTTSALISSPTGINVP